MKWLSLLMLLPLAGAAIISALPKSNEKAAKQAAKQTEKQPEQNGIVRPKAGTSCGKIWALADSLSQKIGAPVTIKALAEIAEAEGYNEATIKTQYARWRKYHGVTGRLVSAPVATPATEAEPVTDASADASTVSAAE